ncbi:MAG: glycosyltransferase family 4 protein [Pseudomonadota bacterium]|nr:glycosyltransferase family 4 protein [Pseudomonadota bacterium]
MSRLARVLMTADAVGGVWTYALDLAAELAAFRIETILMVMGPSPSAGQARRATSTPGLAMIDTALALDWMADEPARMGEAAAAVRELAAESRADIVHLNSPSLAAGGGFRAPVLGVCHSCLATWWMAVKDGPMPAHFRWRTQALWRGLLACDALVAPTRSFAQSTARTYEIGAPLVVHNGRRRSTASRAAREPFIFTSGRLWDEGKNIAVLDAAAALASLPLFAAGSLQGPDGGDQVELRHARALGPLAEAEVNRWLARAPIYASSALYEPFGLGILEGAQAGCALVLADIPSLRELWGGAAVFVDPRQPDGFARAFESLMADEAEVCRLGALARMRAGRFTVRAMGEGILALYRRLRTDLSYSAHEEVVA